MNLEEFVAAAVARGHAGIDADTRMTARNKEAAHAGFAYCSTLTSFADFEAALALLQLREIDLRKTYVLDPAATEEQKKIAVAEQAERTEAFWRHRSFAGQVEWVFNMLCFAAKHNHWPEAVRVPQYMPTARAAKAYAEIVGVQPPQGESRAPESG